jgi:hypothetical protein
MAALQTSGKCSHPTRMLRFPDLSRHSPTLVGGRRRSGLRLLSTLTQKDQRRNPAIEGGALEPDLRL